jgi:hypothetical protein
MGQALFHETPISVARPAEPRRLARGLGLTLGAGVSIGLWAGLVWLCVGVLS